MSSVTSTVDFDADGKHFGLLQIPYSSNTSGWAKICVPVVSIKNGGGRTALVLGGNHGDEYEGPIAIQKLAREVSPDQVSGRLILIPCLSPPAAIAGTRLWPDGANFNRSFPGSPTGRPAEQLAHFLTHELFPRSEIVIDIHSGGRSMRAYPMSHMHYVPDPAQRRAMLEGMLAWNTDYHMLYPDVAGTGLLPSEAEAKGKIVVTTELGGGGYIPASVHRIAEDGLRNVLRHFGILAGRPVTRESLGLPPSTILSALDQEAYHFSPASGVFETLVDPGDPVEKGSPVGRLHNLERPDQEPIVIRAAISGVVCAARAIPITNQGDCVTVIGRPVAKEDLL